MSIYMEYLEGDDRAFFINQSRAINEINKGFALLEMVNMQYEQMCNDAEFKVLEESGTYDDLEYLYKEAEEATNEQSQGVIAQIWNALVKFFKGIFDFLFGAGGKAEELPDDAEIEIPAEIPPAIDQISGFFANPAGAFLKIAGAVSAGSLAVLGAQAGYMKVTKKQGETWIQKIQSGLVSAKDAIQEFIGGMGEKIKQLFSSGDEQSRSTVTDDNGNMHTPQSWWTKFMNFINEKIINPIKNAIDKAKTKFNQRKAPEAPSNDQGQTSTDTPVDNGQPQTTSQPNNDQQVPPVASNDQGQTSADTQTNSGQGQPDNSQQQTSQGQPTNGQQQQNPKKDQNGKAKGEYTFSGEVYKVVNGQISKKSVGANDNAYQPVDNVNTLPKEIRRALGYQEPKREIKKNDQEVKPGQLHPDEQRHLTSNDGMSDAQVKRNVERKNMTNTGINIGGTTYVLKGTEVYKKTQNGKLERVELAQMKNKQMADTIKRTFTKHLTAGAGKLKIENTIDISELRDVLGENYELSINESGDELTIVFNGNDSTEDIFFDVIESGNEEDDYHKLSTEESIFGVIEESDYDDDEKYLQQLADIFGE